MTWLERILATECKAHGVAAGVSCSWMGSPTAGTTLVCTSRIAAAEGVAKPGERPVPAAGQVWNWDNVGEWSETTLIRHEDGGNNPGWVGRGKHGTIGYFWDADWNQMTFVPGPDACPGRRP